MGYSSLSSSSARTSQPKAASKDAKRVITHASSFKGLDEGARTASKNKKSALVLAVETANSLMKVVSQ